MLSATPVAAQLRIDDFGFGAGIGKGGSAEITAGTTLQLGGRAVELLAGTAAQDAFLSVLHSWTHARFTYGAGFGIYTITDAVRPGLAGMLAYGIPLAPSRAAALQLLTRAAVMNGAARASAGIAIRLAPRRGGIMLGENVAPPVAPREAARTWDAIVAQVMLLDNGASSLHDVMVTHTSLVMRFAPRRRAELLEDVGRVARVLSGSADPLYLTVNAPEPAFVAAAATAGGFPAERIITGEVSTVITLQATRTVASAAVRSAR